MKTAVTKTSIEAFNSLTSVPRQCRDILNAMRAGVKYSRRQIASAINLDRGTTSARFHDLIRTGHVQVVGTLQDPQTLKWVEAVIKAPTQLELV